MNKSDTYFRELDQKPIPKQVHMPAQPKESIEVGQDYYTWLNRVYGNDDADDQQERASR